MPPPIRGGGITKKQSVALGTINCAASKQWIASTIFKCPRIVTVVGLVTLWSCLGSILVGTWLHNIATLDKLFHIHVPMSPSLGTKGTVMVCGWEGNRGPRAKSWQPTAGFMASCPGPGSVSSEPLRLYRVRDYLNFSCNTWNIRRLGIKATDFHTGDRVSFR